jgi:precorrin-2 methylase
MSRTKRKKDDWYDDEEEDIGKELNRYKENAGLCNIGDPDCEACE